MFKNILSYRGCVEKSIEALNNMTLNEKNVTNYALVTAWTVVVYV